MEIFGFTFSTWQFCVIAVCAFFGGFTKTGVVGLGILITPLMAGVLPAGTALGFMLPLYLLGDVIAIIRFNRGVMWRPLLKSLPWGIFGTLVSWRFAGELIARLGADADGTLRTIIGVLMGLVVLLGWYVSRHPETAVSVEGGTEGRVRTWYAGLLGTFAGFVSMLTNSGGPVWAMFFSSLNLEVREVIGSSVWCFFIINMVKVPLSANLGFLNVDTLKFNLLLAPLTVAGVVVGGRFSGRFSKRAFARMLQVFAIVGSLYLILS